MNEIELKSSSVDNYEIKGYPDSIKNWLKQQEEKEKEELKKIKDPNNKQYRGMLKELADEIGIDDTRDDYTDYPRLINEYAKKSLKNLSECLDKFHGNPLGLHLLPLIDSKALKDENVRKSFLQYAKHLLGEHNRINELDSTIVMAFDVLTEDSRFKQGELEQVHDIIFLNSSNCSDFVFKNLCHFLERTKNFVPEIVCKNCGQKIEPSENQCPKCGSTVPKPGVTTKLCNFCNKPLKGTERVCKYCGQPVASVGNQSEKKFNFFESIKSVCKKTKIKLADLTEGQTISMEQVQELYIDIINSMRTTIQNLTEKNIISPLIHDRGNIRHIMDFFSPSNAPENIVSSWWEEFNHNRGVVLDDLIDYYAHILRDSNTQWFSGIDNAIRNSIETNIIAYVKEHPDSRLREKTLECFKDKGDLTIYILREFLKRKLNRVTMSEGWAKEKGVKEKALKICRELLQNESYEGYHRQIAEMLEDLVTESKEQHEREDLSIRKQAIEILLDYHELKLVNFEKIIDLDTENDENKELHKYFYRLIVDRLTKNDSNTNELAVSLIRNSKSILKGLFVHQDIEADEKEKVIITLKNSKIEDHDAKIFYEIIEELNDNNNDLKVIEKILESAICSESIFNCDELSKCIDNGSREKVDKIIAGIQRYVANTDKKLSKEDDVMTLVKSIVGHKEFKTFDKITKNRFLEGVIERLITNGHDDALTDKVFHKLLQHDEIDTTIKNNIIKLNVKKILQSQDHVDDKICNFIKDCFVDVR